MWLNSSETLRQYDADMKIPLVTGRSRFNEMRTVFWQHTQVKRTGFFVIEHPRGEGQRTLEIQNNVGHLIKRINLLGWVIH